MAKKKQAWHSQKVAAARSKRNLVPEVPGSNSGLQNNDAGIFVTCARGREGKAVAECVDLIEKAAAELTLNISTQDQPELGEDEDVAADLDIETAIANEVESLKPQRGAAGGQGKHGLLRAVRLDIPCVSFIKTSPPLDPVQLVTHICTSALNNPTEKRSRFIKRLTPVTRIKKILSGHLETACEEVLTDIFRQGGSVKYAIRPSIRQNNDLNRDTVIKAVAAWIGSSHTVDLKGYDWLVIVEVYRNVIGLSVVPNTYEKLRRFNLDELFDPRPHSGPEPGFPDPASGLDKEAEGERADDGGEAERPVKRVKTTAVSEREGDGE